MIETRFRETIRRYQDIVESIELFQCQEEERISKLKVKLRLFDGSILWVREISKQGNIDSYSYYWLRSDETTIAGWDNAPHHRNVDSFPHHKHTDGALEPSRERTLEEVLESIRCLFE